MNGTIETSLSGRRVGRIIGKDGCTYGFMNVDQMDCSHRFSQGDQVSFTSAGGAARQVSPTSGTQDDPPLSQPPRTTSEQPKTPPYAFVPVDIEKAATDSPVFHNGKNKDQSELISGELRCSLTALTPLLLAHDQYKAKNVSGAKKNKENSDILLPDDWEISYPVTEDKSILEPLRLDGRVLIPGSSLNGMLRHSIGALLSAPMERVAERSYSYRPNLAHVEHGTKYECRPAVVVSNDGSNITVKVLPKPRSAVFLRDKYDKKGNKTDSVYDKIKSQNGGLEAAGSVNNTINNIAYDTDRDRNTDYNRIIIIGDASLALDHVYFPYDGGIDGTGVLASLFNSRNHTYKHALVPAKDWNMAVELPVSGEVLELDHYLATQKHLQDDQHGHLSSRHPFSKEKQFKQAAKGIRKHTDLKPNQLIYVEVELDDDQKPVRVTSFGHNYQYRWRYTDTVRNRWNSSEGKWQPRKVLSPLKDEIEVEDGKAKHAPPKQLSGARLFFGYASPDNEDSGAKGIGKGDFTRLAGRISCNIAVEQTDDPTDLNRFVDKDKPVPLKALGMPRPSAVENYLIQPDDKSALQNTYGDLPGEAGGELRGRKFYPHQPKAADSDSGPDLYELWGEMKLLDSDAGLKNQFVNSIRSLNGVNGDTDAVMLNSV